ncbi:hypothetical protein D3C87_405320 [compost metagenome]
MEDFEKMAYDRARRKAKEIKGFYINLTLYITTVPIIIFVNLTFSPEFHWFWFSAAGWGIGVLVHAMGTFGFPFLGKNWEERKLKELIEKLDKEKEQRTKYE